MVGEVFKGPDVAQLLLNLFIAITLAVIVLHFLMIRIIVSIIHYALLLSILLTRAVFVLDRNAADDISVIIFLELFDQAIISQMRVFRSIARVIVHQCEADVRLRIDPHGERVPVRHQHPNADVELLLMDNQRVLDVLLYDPVPAAAILDVLENVVILRQNSDASAA